MTNSLLVPLDNTAAESALWQLGVLLARPETDVTLVHALESPLGARLDPGREDQLTQRERGAVETLAKRLRDRGVSCETVVKEGRAADLILSVAGAHPAGMIAMSTAGHSALSNAVFGSVTQAVLRASSLPVLLFRDPPGGTARALRIRRILLPVDGSELSLAALPHVRALAKSFGATVIVLGVVETSRHGTGEGEPLVRRAVRQLAEACIPVDTIVRAGRPATEILDVCSRHDVDLVVMSTHGRSGLSRLVMGSATEEVLRQSTVPVLVVPGAANG